MSESAGIGAVVVSHFSASTLAECLRRLLASNAVSTVVVVDNASGDESVAIAQGFADRDARVRILANTDNPGFAVACNQGAAAQDTPWLAFVNPDLLVEPDSLRQLRDAIVADPSIGLIGADLTDADGIPDSAARRREPRLATVLAGGGRRAGVAIPTDRNQTIQPVDAVSGALMLMPSALFRALDGFDPGYRLHAEDLDLCRRVRDAGYRVAVANRVSVVHVRGVSSRRRPLWVEWQKHRGMWRYFSRFEAAGHGRPVRWLVGLGIIAHFLLAAPRSWLRARRR
ncbi:MAG: glycosyltransferase family 2 protein [Xanthomonadaceae bacterium]|nr:glycosyltransferase family 2 protein [Xanthomonadaceae bacterium]